MGKIMHKQPQSWSETGRQFTPGTCEMEKHQSNNLVTHFGEVSHGLFHVSNS